MALADSGSVMEACATTWGIAEIGKAMSMREPRRRAPEVVIAEKSPYINIQDVTESLLRRHYCSLEQTYQPCCDTFDIDTRMSVE